MSAREQIGQRVSPTARGNWITHLQQRQAKIKADSLTGRRSRCRVPRRRRSSTLLPDLPFIVQADSALPPFWGNIQQTLRARTHLYIRLYPLQYLQQHLKTTVKCNNATLRSDDNIYRYNGKLCLHTFVWWSVITSVWGFWRHLSVERWKKAWWILCICKELLGKCDKNQLKL